MAEIFISYARPDRDAVEKIAQALTGQGFDVWWDPELLPGQKYAEEISGVLAEAKAVIVVWSPSSIERSWVLDEAAEGRDKGKLVPISIGGVEAPLGFRQFETVDLSGWTGAADDGAFQRLVAALAALRAQPGAARPKPAVETAPPHRRGRLLIAAAVITAGALAALAVQQISGGGGTSTVPPPEPPISTGETDSPGADETYGLTDEELLGFGAQDTIRIALANTTIDKIEEDAAGGDPLGMSLACLAYAFGEGVVADPARAQETCGAAADANEPLGLYMVARLAREAGAADAQALLQRAADAGDPRALNDLARAAIAAGDPASALTAARAAAEKGHHPAEVLLGWMYEYGQGVTADPAAAFRWYDRAAEKAYPAALTATARLIEEGRGAPQDYPRAIARYTEAAAQGDGEAAFRLSRIYEMGLGVPADPDRARTLMEEAVANGYSQAEAELARMRGETPPP